MRMKATVLVLILAPAVVFAQATPAPKPASKPAPMTHDMGKMGTDTAMKHDMSGMQHDMAGMTMDAGKKGGMSAMPGGMMQGGMTSGWGELDAFHSLLMATWHPAEKDSVALARSLAATLSAAADAWVKSKGPKACDNAAMRQALPEIVASTKAYASVAANSAKDADVKAALKKVHDGFEKAAMPCLMAGMKGMPGMPGMGGMGGMGGMDNAAMHQGVPAKKP